MATSHNPDLYLDVFPHLTKKKKKGVWRKEAKAGKDANFIICLKCQEKQISAQCKWLDEQESLQFLGFLSALYWDKGRGRLSSPWGVSLTAFKMTQFLSNTEIFSQSSVSKLVEE